MNNTHICWIKFGKSILYTNKSTGVSVEFRVGDTITFQERPSIDPLVIITSFSGDDINGPIGMCYLPWRTKEQRWGTRLMTLKGDPRHIICPPLGISHYGQHIDWSTVCHVLAIDHPEYTKKVKELTHE